jgi:hypothetical protein
MRAVLTAGILFASVAIGLAGQAVAEDGCQHFAWSVEREREWFGDGFTATVESRSALPKDGVFSLRLQPVGTVIYLIPPERGRDDGLGGIVTLEWVTAGRYQVTLSSDAWVDAVQDDRRLPILASTRRDDCPGIRLSVQFEIAESSAITLQFGGATVRQLNIAVLRSR